MKNGIKKTKRYGRGEVGRNIEHISSHASLFDSVLSC